MKHKIEVHPSAVIAQDTRLAEGVTIGPNCVIDSNVSIGAGTMLDANVVVGKNVKIGENNRLFPNCAIGGRPQDTDGNLEPGSHVQRLLDPGYRRGSDLSVQVS